MKKEYLSIYEVFKILSSKKETNEIEGDSLSYVERVKSRNIDARKVKKELMEKFGIEEKVAVKLVDLLPSSKEELVAILSSYSVIKDEKEMTEIQEFLISSSS
ncbi:MAG: Rpb4 family DNA-directed RNA polymerase subunit [Thermoplasmataceae archaeon]